MIEEYAEDIVKLVEKISLEHYLTKQQALECVKIASGQVSEKNNDVVEIYDYDQPITVAEKLISATCIRKCSSIDRIFQKAFTGKELDEIECDMFNDDDLKEIAEHLLVYVNRQEGQEGGDNS